MRTPAAIAQIAARILGGTWAAEGGTWGVNGRLATPETDTFTLHVDDHGHLCLETVFDGSGEIGRFPEPTTADDAETTARDVAEVIRLYLANKEGKQDATLYQELNRGVHFSGADYSDPEMSCHPSSTVAGAACFFYIDEAGVLRVSVHLDGLTEIGTRIWGEDAVPMRITLDGGVVFASIGTWVVQFQHPEDGGDDGVWEYAIPAEEAPTDASARALATERFLADLNSHENADAWTGTTIRSVRLTDHPSAA
ncbi:hypothetical protein [Streptomyces sp. NPDC005784]|uniref:hypothetical protein n=1 Tax=Streptomyces sp. NPDC005784 TaxID=3364731 RepID=UPI003686E59C